MTTQEIEKLFISFLKKTNVIENVLKSQAGVADIMSLPDAAKYMNRSQESLRALVRRKKIPASKGGDGRWYFKRADLDAFRGIKAA